MGLVSDYRGRKGVQIDWAAEQRESDAVRAQTAAIEDQARRNVADFHEESTDPVARLGRQAFEAHEALARRIEAIEARLGIGGAA